MEKSDLLFFIKPRHIEKILLMKLKVGSQGPIILFLNLKAGYIKDIAFFQDYKRQSPYAGYLRVRITLERIW